MKSVGAAIELKMQMGKRAVACIADSANDIALLDAERRNSL